MELKPCPFCGGKTTMHRDSWETPSGKAVRFWCRCSKCGACSEEFQQEEKAAEAWNRRVEANVVEIDQFSREGEEEPT